MRDINDFVTNWSNEISSNILIDFPGRFIEGKKSDILNLPGKPLLKGSQLFGTYEVIDIEGELVHSSNDPNEIKYILYSNRNYPKEIKILTSSDELETAVAEYEIHLDNILMLLKDDFKSHFPNSINAEEVINKVFRILNLQRF